MRRRLRHKDREGIPGEGSPLSVFFKEPLEGFEPSTCGLRNRRSLATPFRGVTAELQWPGETEQGFQIYIFLRPRVLLIFHRYIPKEVGDIDLF